VLTSGNCNYASLEIYVLPIEPVLLSTTHASMKGKVKLGLALRVKFEDLISKPYFLFLIQKSYSFVVFLATLDESDAFRWYVPALPL
jgi:hypothetical protein